MLNLASRLRMTVVAAAASGLLLQSCDREAAPAAEMEAPVEPLVSAPLQPVTPEPALDREALLAAVAKAASDYAAGAPWSGSDPLVRRTFDISIAFGCRGAEAPPADDVEDGLARWSWGADLKTVRLSLIPADWSQSDLLMGSAGSVPWEAVEGLWVARPWMTTDGCPVAPTGPLASGPVSASPETVGLAAVFEQGGSRLGQRNGRAYAHTVRHEGDAAAVALREGYRLRLQGRITAFPDGRAIHCRSTNRRQRPVCVAAVQLDQVAFRTAAGETLSEWRPA
jgi:hypothetical protein